MGAAVISFLEKSLRRLSLARFVAIFAVFVAVAVLCLSPETSANAAPTPAAPAAKAPDKLLIDADELIYDKDKNTVTASGSVQLF
jgi:LPS-assembly protein